MRNSGGEGVVSEPDSRCAEGESGQLPIQIHLRTACGSVCDRDQKF